MAVSMREKLELWRKEKGRTAMKRLSYVMPYSEECGTIKPTLKQPKRQSLKPKNSVTPHTTRTGIHSSHFKMIADSQKITHQRLKKNVCLPIQSFEKQIENQEAPVPVPSGVNSCKDLRNALEAWQAAHGRSLKRPKSVIPTSSRTARVRRHTTHVPHAGHEGSPHAWPQQGSQPVGLGCSNTGLGSFVSCSQAEPPGIPDGSVVQRLDFECAGNELPLPKETARLSGPPDHTPPTRRRRTCVHFVDDTVVFGSTAIKYSRLRSDRRCTTAATPTELSGTIFVTPVRRSTRKNKSTLGVELDNAVCFDSPSDLNTAGSSCVVKVVPNLALLFNNS